MMNNPWGKISQINCVSGTKLLDIMSEQLLEIEIEEGIEDYTGKYNGT